VADDSPTLKKIRRILVDNITCWELAAKAQMMVDVELVCDIEVTIDDDNGGEGGE
jgi:hypothetical protein